MPMTITAAMLFLPECASFSVAVKTFLIVLSLAEVSSSSSVCKGKDTDPCKCELLDGTGVIDLSVIGKKDSPAFNNLDATDEYDYSYNPCFPFDIDDGQGSTLTGLAAIQCDESDPSQQATCYDIGVQESTTFFKDDTGSLAINYTAKDGGSDARSSVVRLKCNSSRSKEKVTANGETEDGSGVYEFIMAGPNVCAKKEGSGLSGGSILLIIFFVLVFVYFAVGIIYNKTKNNASGTDLIPNKGFWISLPGLIKDGVMFLVYKCKGTPPPDNYENI